MNDDETKAAVEQKPEELARGQFNITTESNQVFTFRFAKVRELYEIGDRLAEAGQAVRIRDYLDGVKAVIDDYQLTGTGCGDGDFLELDVDEVATLAAALERNRTIDFTLKKNLE